MTSGDQSSPVPVLAVRGLSKSFPGVQALSEFTMDVRTGEVHAVVGQNGAGKSTLIKLLAGSYRPDAGVIEIDGRATTLYDAAAAIAQGIGVIHQDLNLVPIFDVAENMMLGLRQPKCAGVVLNRRARAQKVRSVLDLLETDFGPHAAVASLTVSQQQMVAIGRALLLDARVLIMDEPTAALGAREVEQVLRIVGRLRSRGHSVIFVSHRLEEVATLADRITVMRDGRLVGTFHRGEITSRSQLIQLIIGRSERELVRARRHTATGEVTLSARGLCWRGKVRDVDLDLRAGEVTGLAGLVGSGRSELVSMLFGALRPDAGEVTVRGRRITRFSPAVGIRAGVALLPEDRRGQGTFTSLTVRENITVSALHRFSFGPFLSRARERRTCRALCERLGIVARGPESRLGQLSGGNQQKVVIAKWLQTEADVLLFDEPTQGVDVGAQEEIHRLMRDLAHEGKAVVLISSDLEETLRVADRTVVLRRGRVVGDVDGDEATVEEVLALCFGADEISSEAAADRPRSARLRRHINNRRGG